MKGGSALSTSQHYTMTANRHSKCVTKTKKLFPERTFLPSSMYPDSWPGLLDKLLPLRDGIKDGLKILTDESVVLYKFEEQFFEEDEDEEEELEEDEEEQVKEDEEKDAKAKELPIDRRSDNDKEEAHARLKTLDATSDALFYFSQTVNEGHNEEFPNEEHLLEGLRVIRGKDDVFEVFEGQPFVFEFKSEMDKLAESIRYFTIYEFPEAPVEVYGDVELKKETGFTWPKLLEELWHLGKLTLTAFDNADQKNRMMADQENRMTNTGLGVRSGSGVDYEPSLNNTGLEVVDTEQLLNYAGERLNAYQDLFTIHEDKNEDFHTEAIKRFSKPEFTNGLVHLPAAYYEKWIFTQPFKFFVAEANLFQSTWTNKSWSNSKELE
eukprot:Filipodium_phascolosomae@DN2060_c0_g1_i1.p1